MNEEIELCFEDGSTSEDWLDAEIEKEIDDANFDNDLDLEFEEIEFGDWDD